MSDKSYLPQCLFFVILFFTAGCTNQKEDSIKNNSLQQAHFASSDIDEFVEMLYGKNGAELSLEQIFMMQDLIKSLLSLSQEKEQQVAAKTIKMLQEKITEQSQLTKLVNTYIMTHLQQFAHDNQDSEDTDPVIAEIAQKIVDYINIEQTDIFSHEKTKHLFITILERSLESYKNQQKNYPLPALIDFWTPETGKMILQNYDPSDEVKIQMIGAMLLDMAIMMGATMGASMANAELGTQAQALANQINKNNQTIQTTMQAFHENAQKKQQIELQAMISAFSKAQQNVQSQMTQASQSLNLELEYLYKNISIDQPQQNYIFNQIQYDQLFTLGTMLTPEGPLWKNPFSVGDWEYEKSSNSFWQYQSAPLFNKKTDSSGNETSSSLQAENNSIFAEYFTKNKTYTISGSITLYAVSYPFFAGIMFNKSRWISGDFESIRKCRMIGIFGTSATDVGIYCAQQFTMTDDQLKNAPSENPIQTPLQQIINHKIQPSLPLPTNLVAALPATLYFSIDNAPTSVTFNFWIDENNRSIPITIDKLDDEIYRYHGIGFICPGATAEFKLTQPTDFIFSDQAISNYKD
ncbi:OmpH family outer membrane protein [Candidatus Babeliales bacterium]|nr:OmpH family outer membrane protein [Candidatus Babeliales bacterium]MBP9843441.1 OmpH family outer membrane protein [Candidatus Babeliales bacterium]